MHKLPLKTNLNSVDVLLQLNKATNKLGELNGILRTLLNPRILLSSIVLGESKASSKIENIFTTYDELYQEMTASLDNQSAKEVLRYREAINIGTKIVSEKNIITTNDIILLHHIIEPEKGDIRKLPGTVIKNAKTGEIVHTPPQNETDIRMYLQNLEEYINTNNEYDPLINMAVIHYQFEAIHPFYDGNGRTGRILNVLFLLLKDKLKIPVIYLSKYINDNKHEYYQLLKDIQNDEDEIEKFVIYMLKAVEEMSIFTIKYIKSLNETIEITRKIIKKELPKIYSAEVVDAIFYEFYTKNEYFRKTLGISRNTASSYLNQLVNIGVLSKEKVGKEMIYKNVQMFILINEL